MAKTKKKTRPLSDKVRSKKQSIHAKVNPFEVKINKQKHEVLGKKIAKFDKGRPGMSRSRAIQKRKETLLEEYKKRGKANKLMDRRFGENDAEMSVEDKMLQRFALERQKHHEKAGAFSLNEEDELTHYGQSLAEIEKFEDPQISDEDFDDDEDRGRITAKLVAEEHFGGGTLKKADDSEGKHKSWKERMEEVIAKSKKEKYERQHEKEKAREMTEQLDKEWTELRFSMASSLNKNKDDAGTEKKKADDFDVMVRELQFEIRGKATDRLKTEEEIAKEEKERLEKLEADRLRRMKGLTEEEEQAQKLQRKHMSADDLDDGFNLDSKVKFAVSYKDGKMIKPGGMGSEDNGSENEESENDESGEELDEEKDKGHESGEESSASEDDNEDQEGNQSESESESGLDALAHLSDLESDGESDSGEEESPQDGQKEGGIKSQKSAEVKDIKSVLKKKKDVMEQARKELPYTFKAPKTYSDLVSLLEGHHIIDQVIIVERLRTCHHPSLAEGNKEKLETLFTLLLQYYGNMAVQSPPQFSLLDKLVPHLYELMTQNRVPAAQSLLDIVLEKQHQFTERCEARGGKGAFPTLDVMLYLKLVSILFPTSDLKHAVVTPAMLFISQILTQSCIQSCRDVASGLFVCNLVLEYVSYSKRYVPEVINFLRGLLFLSIQKEPNKIEPVIPPFKPLGKYNNLLHLNADQSEYGDVGQMKLGHIYTPQKALTYLSSDDFKLSAIKLTVNLLQKFSTLYKDLPSYKEIFQPVQYFVAKLPVEKYPLCIKDLIQELSLSMEVIFKKPRKALQIAKQPLKALKMYEPKVQEDFDPSRKQHSGGKDSNEKKRLAHKYKREMKGAVRELRKDAQFIAKQKLDEQIQRDQERKRKVRELFGHLASQEGDYKALKRKKDKL